MGFVYCFCKEKNGLIILCYDYGSLNFVVIKDVYLLLLLNELIKLLVIVKYFYMFELDSDY